MSVAKKMEGFIEKSSFIRKMFEEGARMKGIYGADNVYDFSLGNPNVPPPALFLNVFEKLAKENPAMIHGYMPNPGFPNVRAKIAAQVTKEQGVEITGEDVIMTCGAAGALNIILKAIVNPDDEIIVPAPYFVEYNFYADNHGGSIKPVPSNKDFSLNLEAIEKAISPKSCAVLINTPNNPTGQVYPAETLKALGTLLEKKGKEIGRTIFLISDEPYRKIIYDGGNVPSLFAAYKDSLIATSYSKDLSLAGERIGYVSISPRAADREKLQAVLTLANRILGFVNAPAFMQRVVAELQGVTVDMGEYARKRDLLCAGLKEAGYSFTLPKGAFYLFPASPIADDVAFVSMLKEERILAVPGSGFAGPGHFRLSFCIADETIKNSFPGFRAAMKKAKAL